MDHPVGRAGGLIKWPPTVVKTYRRSYAADFCADALRCRKVAMEMTIAASLLDAA